MKLSCVIPVLNEQDNLSPLYQGIETVMRELASDFEIIFVDDGSTDGSLQQLEVLHRKDPRVKILSLSRNFGHQMALTAGMDAASGDACILMDADFQHPPEIIQELVANWKNGYDIVYTTRQATEDANVLKRGTELFFYTLFRWLSGVGLSANAADFRLLDKKVVSAFKEIRERIRFLRGLTGWVGYRSVGIAYRAPQRRSGSSKYSLWRMLQLAIDGLTSFTAVPLYVAIYLGVIFTLVGTLYVPYAIYVRFIIHNAVPGWASLITVICFIGGLQLLLLGVMGIYIAKIYEEVKHRPLYLVRKSLGLTPRSQLTG